MKIAVVFTCFNRKEQTKECIDSIIQSHSSYQHSSELCFYVCDDCSNDGTKEMLKSYKEIVKVIDGTGKLFWAGGMAQALSIAENWEPDFYLMVNDDVKFKNNVIEIMFNSYKKHQDKLHAIVGATKDVKLEKFTYGGYMWNWKAHGKTIIPVIPDSVDKCCNTANWNCFLIPRKLYENCGKIDATYEHSFADFDYSNRMTVQGYKMYTADYYVGYCSRNNEVGTWRDKSLPILKRIKQMHSPNGFPPKSHWRYCKKYYGVWAIYMFIRPYLSIIKAEIMNKGEKH